MFILPLLVQVTTEPFTSWVLANGSETLLWGYLFVDKVLPKFFPEMFKVWNRRVSSEERLFRIIEESNDVIKDNAVALSRIEEVIRTYEGK